ncbi:ABC transporter permease [Mucilaginibacter sp. SJ]|uniref:ABC transporter permease n=1 Tax=Mucilaginibacter sp. SJ TaxID=3029053 RepID=UPI0023A98BF3|nr:FtsX-like permease family protein [Mucilaginibacter sp. SJ]WEA02640.1 FtsX-like permease family protein [Mucilaginibacter sp. SJ]
MFKHLFKLIWNKKKQNFLLISEMLVSFLVIFAVSTLVVYYYKNYKKPIGFDYKKVWVINYNNAVKSKKADSLTLFYETLRQTIKSMPQIEEVSYASNNYPFAFNQSNGGYDYNKRHLDGVDNLSADDNYARVFNLQVLSGRWFSKQDAVYTSRPVVINELFKQLVFGNENPIGKLLGNEKDKLSDRMRVIGVVSDMKLKGDYKPANPGVYSRLDTGSYAWVGTLLLKTGPTADAAFESRLYKTVSNAMKNSNVEIEHLDKKLVKMNQVSLVPAIILFVVATFLIINVALGLFGVLWYNINKRRSEIGLRRAIGATGKSVSWQLVTESLILATISLVIGAFFAAQFPLLNVFDMPPGVYMIAIFLSVLFIYVLVLLCSLYPGKQAAAIYPAVALHEE